MAQWDLAKKNGTFSSKQDPLLMHQELEATENRQMGWQTPGKQLAQKFKTKGASTLGRGNSKDLKKLVKAGIRQGAVWLNSGGVEAWTSSLLY